MTITLQDCRTRDAQDPLRSLRDHFALPPGTRVSFGINEAADATRDNAGVISLEILVDDTPRRGSQ